MGRKRRTDYAIDVVPFTVASGSSADLDIAYSGDGPLADMTADQIKGVRLYLTASTNVTGTPTAGAALCTGYVGIKDDSDFFEWHAIAVSENNQATTDTESIQDDDSCLALYSPASLGSYDFKANFKERIDGGIRLEVSNAASAAWEGYAVIYAGDSMSCYAGVSSQISTGETITSLDDTPYQIWFGGTRAGGASAWAPTKAAASAALTIGVANVGRGGAITNRCYNWLSRDDRANGEMSSVRDDDSFMYHFFPGSGTFTSHYVSAVASDGFTVTRRDGSGDNSYGWFAISCPGLYGEASWESLGSTDDVDVDYDVDTETKGLTVFCDLIPTESNQNHGTINDDTKSNAIGIGSAGYAGGRGAFAGITDEDASASSDCDSYCHNQRICSYGSPSTGSNREGWYLGGYSGEDKGRSLNGNTIHWEEQDTTSGRAIVVSTFEFSDSIVQTDNVDDADDFHVDVTERICVEESIDVRSTDQRSWLDHFNGSALDDDRWGEMLQGSGAVTVSGGVVNLDKGGASGNNAGAMYHKNKLDLTKSCMAIFQVRVVTGMARPLIRLVSDTDTPTVVANEATEDGQFRTGAIITATGELQLVYDTDGDGSYTYWHGEEEASANTFQTSAGDAIADFDVGASEDWHMIAFEIDAENEQFRWHAMHRSGRTAITDLDQGMRWVAQTDWVSFSAFDTSEAFEDIWIVIGGYNRGTTADSEIDVDLVIFESASTDDVLGGFTNAKESDSDNYNIRQNHSYGTMFFEKDRGGNTYAGTDGEIPYGASSSWNEFGYRKKKVVRDAAGIYWLFVEGFDSALTDTSIGLYSSSSIDGPWTEFTGNPIIVPTDIATAGYDQVTAPWPFYDESDATWKCYVGAQSDAGGSIHRLFLFESDGDIDGNWSLVPGSGTDGAIMEESGTHNWRHSGVNDIVLLSADAGDFRALISGFRNGYGWSIGYATGTNASTWTIDDIGGPYFTRQNARDQFSAVSGATITVSDSSKYDIDAPVIIRNADSSDNWAISRVRSRPTSTTIELYHEVGGLSTADADRSIAQFNAGSVTPHGVQSTENGKSRIYCTCFQPFIMDDGTIGNMETVGSIVAADLADPSTWVFDYVRSPHVFLNIWEADRNNENLNFHDSLALANTVDTTEGITVTEDATAAAGYVVEATEDLTVTEDATELATYDREATSDLTATEDATELATYDRTATEALTVNEDATVDTAILVEATEDLTVTEDATELATYDRAATEALTVNEDATELATYERAATDDLTTTEDATADTTILVDATEAITVTEDDSELATYDRAATEAITVTEDAAIDHVASEGTDYTRDETSDLTVSESFDPVADYYRSMTEAVTVEEIGANTMPTSVESIAVTESSTVTLTAGSQAPVSLSGAVATVSLRGEPRTKGLRGSPR